MEGITYVGSGTNSGDISWVRGKRFVARVIFLKDTV